MPRAQSVYRVRPAIEVPLGRETAALLASEALAVLRIVNRAQLEDVIERGRGHHGAATLRALMNRRGEERVTQSHEQESL